MIQSILYLDGNRDEHIIIRLVVNRVGRGGCTVECTASVGDAISAMRAKRFDLIVIDEKLPPFEHVNDALPMFRKYMAGAELLVVGEQAPCSASITADADRLSVSSKLDVPKLLESKLS